MPPAGRRAAAASARSRLADTAGDDEQYSGGASQQRSSSGSNSARRQAGTRKVSSSSSSRRAASSDEEAEAEQEEEEEDDYAEEEEEHVPAARKTSGSRRAPASSSAARKPLSARQPSASSRARRSQTAETAGAEAEDADEHAAIPAKGGAVRAKPARVVAASEDDKQEDMETEAGMQVKAEDAAVMQDVQTGQTPSATLVRAPAGSKTRLTIHKMVLQDFKSYAGRQEIGPFHKSFSAVVGPNGSGKSNVIDALLFVFGWRANKMRQGKLGELIHNSAGKEDLPSCTVDVWFREIEDLPGPDAFRVVPNSRLIIGRTAFKSNTSNYTINGRKSTFTEVTTLLKGRGIDLDHKRFLILQGEVESIAQMPPKGKTEHEEGLLEYLEDIIGTSDYKAPIEAAAVKVDECNEQRSVKLERLKYVQKEKQSLENKKREAEAYLRDQNELAQRQSALWQYHMMECRKQMAIASAAIEQLQGRLDKETAESGGMKTEVDSLTKELEAATAQYKTAEKEAEKAAKELAKVERGVLQAEERQKHIEAKRKKVEKALADEKRAISAAKSTAIDSAEQAEKLQEEISVLESSLEREESKLEDIREGLRDKTEHFTTQIEAHQRQLEPWTAKIVAKRNEKEIALGERALLVGRQEQARAQIDEAKASLQQLAVEADSYASTIETLRKEKAGLAGEIQSAETSLQRMRTDEVKLRSSLATARNKLEEARAATNNQQAKSQVLTALKRQADLGLIKGFHGRLGSLGVIDDRYDVAISTACPGLDSIVVDNVEGGQACIEHLRKNNLGRANFILLDSLDKSPVPKVTTPENAPRLFDLVQPTSPVYAAAFYHQLRDTLVGNDLAHANRLAYGATRWRVVTLDGQLIDKSGAMSGGGARVASGAMSSKLQADDMTPEKMARLAKERDLHEGELRALLKSLEEMREMLARHQARGPEVDTELDRARMAVEVSKQRREDGKKRLAELSSEAELDSSEVARVAELDRAVVAIDADLAKFATATESIEQAIQQLQDKILEVGGIELRTQKSKVDGIAQMISLANERLTKAKVAEKKAEKDLSKAQQHVAEHESSLVALDAEVKDAGAGATSTNQETQQAEDKVRAAEHHLEEVRASRDDIQARLDELSESVNEFRALEMSLKQKLDDNEKSLADNRKRLAHWTERCAGLRIHEFDEGDAGAEDDLDEAPLELVEYPDEDLEAFDTEGIKAEIIVYEERLSKGHANLSILEEYRKREQDFLHQARELEATTKARDEAKAEYDMLRKERLDRFLAGFSVISSKLKEMYQTITLGGNAELELVDSLDPFSEGIIFSVMPPKKSWKNISNLSGGEKTLSSLALVFALHSFKPTPLYVMDEIDAALDFRNVSIVANLIKERTKNAQFVIISLRNNMFELASRLVGIYKTCSMTKSLTIENKDIQLVASQQTANGQSQKKDGSAAQRRGTEHVPSRGVLQPARLTLESSA